MAEHEGQAVGTPSAGKAELRPGLWRWFNALTHRHSLPIPVADDTPDEVAQRGFSVAMTSPVHDELLDHLAREDGQEDLTFVVWKPSSGAGRDTALICAVVLPGPGERHLHGNVSFESSYFLRACDAAAKVSGGVALIHTHPGARTWQSLSRADFDAESGHAAQALALTGLPLVGLTLGSGNGTYSARVWRREGPRTWSPTWAESVRVVGDRMRVSLPDGQAQYERRYQRRTIDAWGPETQQVVGSLRVAVVGAGSVGSQVIEALARTGFGDLVILDFDSVEDHNLDRILNATIADAEDESPKAAVAADAARAHATHPAFRVRWADVSAVEADGIAILQDCDLVFSCVDRPAGRATLNALAYAHLIPVVDGGVLVRTGKQRMRGAEWRAHVVVPGRRCLECLGQFDAGVVQADRDGLLEDPSYLDQLPDDSPWKRNENVFAFSAAAAAEQVLAALRMLVAPGGVADAGAQTFHFATGTVDIDTDDCDPGCMYAGFVAGGDPLQRPLPHRHVTAERARAERAQRRYDSGP